MLSHNAAAPVITKVEVIRYGVLALPLAFAALPIYVQAPHYYAEHFSIPLASLGVLLLILRALDAVIDPYIGRWIDRQFQHHQRWRLIVALIVAALCLQVGFVWLWFPPITGTAGLGMSVTTHLCLALMLTFGGFSVLSITHAAWGAKMATDIANRHYIVSWREGFGLFGVVMASVLPTLLGFGLTATILAVLLAISLFLLLQAPPSHIFIAITTARGEQTTASPWASFAFRCFMFILIINGIASAFPATLLPFFVADRLQDSAALGYYLLIYFFAAGLSLPFWHRLVKRYGLVRAWQMGMLLAILAFIGVAWLESGDGAWFAVICWVTGVAFGVDLTVPPALLAGIIQRAHVASGQPVADNRNLVTQDAVFFGWWACANKMNLALAVGLALPILQWLGYSVGSRQSEALMMLTFTYSVFPCAMKMLALLFLVRWSNFFGATKND